MSKEKRLVPRFSLGKPNIKSCSRKNEKGLCAIGTCKRTIEPDNHRTYFGFRICKEHWEIVDEADRKWQAALDEEYIKWLGGLDYRGDK